MNDPVSRLYEDDYEPDPLTAALASGADPLDLLDRLASLRPAWHRSAACRGVGPETFYVERGGDTRPAKALCAGCPVTDPCREAARDEFHGIWAGASALNLRRGHTAA